MILVLFLNKNKNPILDTIIITSEKLRLCLFVVEDALTSCETTEVELVDVFDVIVVEEEIGLVKLL